MMKGGDILSNRVEAGEDGDVVPGSLDLPNAVDVIEDMSHDVKRAFFEDKQSTLRDLAQTTAAELLAEQQRQLFAQPAEEEQEEEELMEAAALPNVSEIGFYLEQAGVGLGREEMQRVFLALKQLVGSQALLRCRLWGKVLGTESSYIVAEAEYREGEEEEEKSFEEVTEEEEREEETQENERDQLPQSAYKPPPAVPKEDLGTGTNKFVYYVCKEPGLPWVKLPAVSPEQITAARQIRKFFTGRLDTPVVSYPPFPGNEAQYLRAQIARISAGTQVSPQGFFQAGKEEGDEEDETTRDSFEGIPAAKMAESLSTWVHHVQHILQQGRCTWVNLAVKTGEDSEEGEAEEKEELDEPEPEVGPPLKFENIYVGWGLKYAGEGYSPALPPLPQKDYPSGPEITEAFDPSLEQELVMKEALEEQQSAIEEMEDIDDEDDEEDDD
ncbi:Radial spoke head protein 4 A [Liparis tanakae]|uniref:Radial spoke head protein 4 A n=1 Tax=Liparis tanakae TaxID=230148 RepID=A0A4Z2IIF7_9TELE|nr:Radial spoke head protein 4 A [Liparis tanakae]